MLKSFSRFMKPVALFILILAIEENDAAAASEETRFHDWAHIVLVGTGASLLILGPILVLALFRCCAKKKPVNLATVDAEAQYSPTPMPVRQNTVGDEDEAECASPIYCEAKDIFEFPRREQHSETTTTGDGETIETELQTSVGSEADSEYQYCYPQPVDDVYETMNGVRPDSEEYSCAYDYLNGDYQNTFPRRAKNGAHDDYEYPQNNRNSSECEYRYAYDWWTPSFMECALTSSASEPVLEYCSMDKGNVDENCYFNCQTLSKENVKDENETVVLEYVTIL